MTRNTAPPGYRWLGMDEPLFADARWFDASPEGVIASLPKTEHPDIYDPAPTFLLECHAERHKDWPSDAHGLCGIVVPAGVVPATKHLTSRALKIVAAIKRKPGLLEEVVDAIEEQP